VFVRAPEAGKVKARLAAAVGDAAALRVYRALAEHAMAQARASGADVRVHCTPAGSEEAVRAWLGAGAEYLPQAAGDLGMRMRAAFDQAFAAGYGRAVVIGSDLPEMSGSLLREAFDALAVHPAVVGPAVDGGYYLLGLRAAVRGLFEGVDWGTSAVLEQTLTRFREAGIQPARLDERRDVDEVGDLPAGWRWLLG
jgi:uncharacterized protein